MKPPNTPARMRTRAQPPTRKAYQKPQLQVYGDLAEITQGRGRLEYERRRRSPEHALYVLRPVAEREGRFPTPQPLSIRRTKGNGLSQRFRVVVAVRAPRAGIAGRIPFAILAEAATLLPRFRRQFRDVALVDGPQRTLAHHWREPYRFRLARQGRDLDPASYADVAAHMPGSAPATSPISFGAARPCRSMRSTSCTSHSPA